MSRSKEANSTPEIESSESDFYWCFISYRHKDNLDQDRNWASWLHQEIERYEVPAEMVGKENCRGDTIPERIYPVFRDEESLPADADLGNSIVSALDRSKFLVALCSPRAVASQYVKQEITHFIESGKENRIIAALLSGEPGGGEYECFPVPLREIVNKDGKVSEPIAADFRLRQGREVEEGFTSAEAYRLQLVREGKLPKKEIKKRAEAYENQLQLMKLKIIAGILGVRLEELRDRDKAYQLELAKRRAGILRRTLFVVVTLAMAAIASGLLAVSQRERAEKALEESQQLLWQSSFKAWSEAEDAYQSDDPSKALAILAYGMKSMPKNRELFSFTSSLIGHPDLPYRRFKFDHPVIEANFGDSEDHLVVTEFIDEDEFVASHWNLKTMAKLDHKVLRSPQDISEDSWLNFVNVFNLKSIYVAAHIRALQENRTELKNSETQFSILYSSDNLQIIGPDGKEGALANSWEVWPHGVIPIKHGACSNNGLFFAPIKSAESGIAAIGDLLQIDYDKRFGEGRIFPNIGENTYASWSPGDSRLAIVKGAFSEGERTFIEPGEVIVFDLRKQPSIGFFPMGKDESPNVVELPLEWLKVETAQGRSRIHDTSTKTNILEFETDGKTESKVFNGGEKCLVIFWSEESHRFITIDLKSRKIIRNETLEIPAFDYDQIATFHPDGKGMLWLNKSYIVLWENIEESQSPQLKKLPAIKEADGAWLNDFDFFDSGNQFSVAIGGNLLFFTWPKLEQSRIEYRHPGQINSVDFNSDDGLVILSTGVADGAGSNGYAKIYDYPAMNELTSPFRHNNAVEHVGFVGNLPWTFSGASCPDGETTDLRMWTVSGLPVSSYIMEEWLSLDYFNIEGWGGVDIFDDHVRVQIKADKNQYLSADLAYVADDIPSWFYEEFIPFISGKSMSSEGTIQTLSPAELNELYNKFIGKIENDSAVETAYTKIARWALQNPSTRTITPFSDKRYQDLIEELVETYNENTYIMGKIYEMDPRHPLVIPLNYPAAQELTGKRVISDEYLSIYGKERTLRYLSKIHPKIDDSSEFKKLIEMRIEELKAK